MKRAVLIVFLLAACGRNTATPYSLIGDAHRGKVMIDRYGCASCHVIPGVIGEGETGPTLDHMAARLYLAGRFPNVPQNMVLWIRFPEQMKSPTAMPDLNVSDRDARDIAAYLYTLR